MTGFDLEAETWTCPHCQTTVKTTSPIAAGIHSVRCPAGPDRDQTDLDHFDGGGSA